MKKSNPKPITSGGVVKELIGKEKDGSKEQILLNLPSEMKEAIKLAAKDSDMTVTAYLKGLIRSELKRNGYL